MHILDKQVAQCVVVAIEGALEVLDGLPAVAGSAQIQVFHNAVIAVACLAYLLQVARRGNELGVVIGAVASLAEAGEGQRIELYIIYTLALVVVDNISSLFIR